MKNILVFGMTDNLGGVESVIMSYYRNFDKSKVHLDFLCNTKKIVYEDEILNNGSKVIKVCARSKDYKKYKKDMDSFFKNHAKEYDTIWVNLCSLANIDYLKYAKKYGIKKRIIHCHNSQNMDSFLRGILHRINKPFLKLYATDFWSCSDEASPWFYSKKIINSSSYLKVNNAIDTNKFKYNESIRNKKRKELNIENKFVIGHIGRFHFQKNQEFLIDIFNELLKLNKDSILLLIGTGEDLEKIKDKVKKLNIENSVKFLGLRKDVPELLQAIDLFLFPSKFEGLGLCIIEAEAANLPVVTSDVVPKETKMSNYLTFLPLGNPKEWAVECNKYFDKIVERKKRKNSIAKCGYNIDEEAKKIENRL